MHSTSVEVSNYQCVSYHDFRLEWIDDILEIIQGHRASDEVSSCLNLFDQSSRRCYKAQGLSRSSSHNRCVNQSEHVVVAIEGNQRSSVSSSICYHINLYLAYRNCENSLEYAILTRRRKTKRLIGVTRSVFSSVAVNKFTSRCHDGPCRCPCENGTVVVCITQCGIAKLRDICAICDRL